MNTPLRIFIGYDAREVAAFQVLCASIIRHATVPVSITPIARHQIRELYTRTRGPLEATDFSMTRFLVPALCGYEGHAVFMDCDMLCRVDVAELLALIAIHFSPTMADPLGAKAVLCCQHDYTPSDTVKFLGQIQTTYPRKNWSSFMVFNNAKCRALTPEYVNTATGLELHRFTWTTDDQIGALPLEFNWLIGEYEPSERAKILHYTRGGPWFEETHNCDCADEWFAERDATLGFIALAPERSSI